MAFACSFVVAGFGMPFFIPGQLGFLCAGLSIVAGSALIWFFERKTRHFLDEDSAWNRFMNIDP